MATKITKSDIVGKTEKVPTENSGEFDLNKFVMGVNSFLSNLGNTMNQAKGLMQNYETLKDKLPNAKKKDEIQHKQPQKHQEVEKAIRPQQTKQEVKPMEQTNPEDKLKKAEQIFNEIHELIKPKMQFLKMVSGAQLLQMALNKDAKPKIIEQIAKRL